MNKERCEECSVVYSVDIEPRHCIEDKPWKWVCRRCWWGSAEIRDRYDEDKAVGRLGGEEGMAEAQRITRFQQDRDDLEREAAADIVNEPPHYKGLVVRVPVSRCKAHDPEKTGGFCDFDVSIESIELRRGFEKSMGFSGCLFDALKYLYRCNKTGNKVEDLNKCIKYIELEIKDA